MDALNALQSVMTNAAFAADASGHITESNPLFVQLLRKIPGDDWRDGVASEDRVLVDGFWNSLFLNPTDTHQPITFRLTGGDVHYQLRAQTVTNVDGGPTGAVGMLVLDDDNAVQHRFETDPQTGLPERSAVLQRMDDLIGEQRHFAVAVILLRAADASDETRRKEAARQLLSTLRPYDLVASSSDGSFLLCANDVAETAAATQMATRISSALQESGIEARIGLAVPDGDVAPATLVREAEAGAYSADDGEVRFAE